MFFAFPPPKKRSPVPHCGRFSNSYQRDSNGGRSREPTEGRLLQSKIVGIAVRCGEKFFQTQSHSKHEYLHSKQQPTIDKSAEAPHADRAPLSNENRAEKSARLKCNIVPDYRTFIDDYLKILDFIEWLKVAYPEKAEFLTKKP